MLNDNSTKREIENRFNNARRVMDDLCRAYYGMTWDEHERLHRKEDKDETTDEGTSSGSDRRGNMGV